MAGKVDEAVGVAVLPRTLTTRKLVMVAVVAVAVKLAVQEPW